MLLQTLPWFVSRELNRAAYEIDAPPVLKRAVTRGRRSRPGRWAAEAFVQGKERGAAGPAASVVDLYYDYVQCARRVEEEEWCLSTVRSPKGQPRSVHSRVDSQGRCAIRFELVAALRGQRLARLV